MEVTPTRTHVVVRSALVLVMAASLLWSAACVKWPDSDVSTEPPDKVLFDRAHFAMEHEHFDVAKITFQTLINTYPDSEYAGPARVLMDGPQFADCDGSWNFLTSCDREILQEADRLRLS